MTRTQCDAGMLALTPMWKVIDNEVFPWALSILVEDERVAPRPPDPAATSPRPPRTSSTPSTRRRRRVPPLPQPQLPPAGRQGHLLPVRPGGEIHNAGGKYSFTFPAEQLEHAHDTLSGKFIHGNDIKENTGKKIANMQTEKYKARQAAYRAFITATVPEKG